MDIEHRRHMLHRLATVLEPLTGGPLAVTLRAKGESAEDDQKLREAVVQAVARVEQRFQGDLDKLSRCHAGLAEIYDEECYADEVRVHYPAAIAFRERLALPHDFLLGEWMLSFARIMPSVGIYGQDQPLLERAIAIFDTDNGEAKQQLECALTQLGLLHFQHRRFAEAEACFARALALLEQTAAPLRYALSDGRLHLAWSREELGDLAGAEDLYRRGLELLNEPYDTHRLRWQLKLAGLYRQMGRPDAAAALYREVISTSDGEFHGINEEDVDACQGLAELALEAGHPDDAERHYLQAMGRAENHPGGSDSATIAVLAYSLGVLHAEMGRAADAAPFLERALAILDRAYGPDSADATHCRQSLVLVYRTLGREAEALATREVARPGPT